MREHLLNRLDVLDRGERVPGLGELETGLGVSGSLDGTGGDRGAPGGGAEGRDGGAVFVCLEREFAVDVGVDVCEKSRKKEKRMEIFGGLFERIQRVKKTRYRQCASPID